MIRGLFQVEEAGLTGEAIRFMQLRILHDEFMVSRASSSFSVGTRRSRNNARQSRDPHSHRQYGAPIPAFDALLHEVHDPLIERFEAKDNFQTTGIAHLRQQFTAQVFSNRSSQVHFTLIWRSIICWQSRFVGERAKHSSVKKNDCAPYRSFNQTRSSTVFPGSR